MPEADVELVRLTIVPNEPIAEVVRASLRAHGIASMQRITDVAFGSGGEFPLSGMGPREILVRSEQLEAARARCSRPPRQTTSGDPELRMCLTGS